MSNLTNNLALVTGASRGIGAATARILAERGVDVAINFRSKGPRAQEVAASIEALGCCAILVQADITVEAEVQKMMREVGALDLLFLNASGGLEKNKAHDYAMQLNATSQDRLVELALPLMRAGGRIVFVTSHLAHFHGEKPVHPIYEPVAASKKAGEMALRARIPELASRGISLVIVSGDMIEGTITPKLMERAERGTIAARREQVGALPTVEEFARAIVDAAGDTRLKNGAVVFVGSVE